MEFVRCECSWKKYIVNSSAERSSPLQQWTTQVAHSFPAVNSCTSWSGIQMARAGLFKKQEYLPSCLPGTMSPFRHGTGESPVNVTHTAAPSCLYFLLSFKHRDDINVILLQFSSIASSWYSSSCHHCLRRPPAPFPPPPPLSLEQV
jgi:hypothetical protein